MSIGWAYREQN